MTSPGEEPTAPFRSVATWRAHVEGVGLVATFAGVRALLSPILGGEHAYTLFVIAVAAAAWRGGTPAAVSSFVLSALAGHAWFADSPPRRELIEVALFGGVSSALTTLLVFTRRCASTLVPSPPGVLTRKLQRHDDPPHERSNRFRGLFDSNAIGAAERGSDEKETHANDEFLRVAGDMVERLRIAQRAARMGMFEFDFRTGENRWSPEMEALYGLAPGSFAGTADAWSALVHPDDRARANAATERALQTGEYSEQFRVIWPDGSVRWMLSLGRVTYDEERRPLRLSGVNVDVTDRQLAEQRLFTVLQSIGDHLVTYDREWRYTYINESGAAILGKKVEELIGRSIWDVFPEAVGNQYFQELQTAMREQRVIRSTHYYAPWKRWWLNHIYPSRDNVTVFSVDITRQKEAEQAAAVREAEFRAMFELAAVGAGEIEAATWRFLRVNQRFCEISGYGETELQTMTLRELTHPEDRDADELRHRPVFAGEGDAWQSEKRIVRKTGEVAWVIVSARLVRNPEGQPDRIVAHILDTTERKQTELALREAREALQREASRLEATVTERTHELREKIGDLEGFSYSVSHDLRSPLRTLGGYAQILTEEYGSRLDATALHYLQRMTRAVERLDQLIQDILTYSQLSRTEVLLAPVALEPLIREVTEQYEALGPGHAKIELREPLASVYGHAALLTQCIANLLGNAVKFVPPGRQPEITIWTEARGDRVRVYFRDNGIGIAPDHHARIFGVFERVTMELSYDGTGIGLAIVQKAMLRMGGSVGLESQLGAGSTFWLELPQP